MKNIAIGGTILTDKIKIIESYPEKGMLSTVTSVEMAVGGCVPNTIIDLAKIDPSLKLQAYGVVGDDADGGFVKQQLSAHGVSIKGITVDESLSTSFSDVYTVAKTGERTFFHYRGANTAFSEKSIDFSSLNCDMFHLGYLMLLDALDSYDEQYSVRSARLLNMLSHQGILTSVDLVSETNAKYASQVIPSIKYCDYLIINEIEAGGITQINARGTDGKISYENIKAILKKLINLGVRKKAIIHCPEAGFAINIQGMVTKVNSLELPSGYIKGSVGAGDAFCAGALYGISCGWDDEKLLEFASGAAALNLSQKDSVSGMKDKEEIFKTISKFTKRKDL